MLSGGGQILIADYEVMRFYGIYSIIPFIPKVASKFELTLLSGIVWRAGLFLALIRHVRQKLARSCESRLQFIIGGLWQLLPLLRWRVGICDEHAGSHRLSAKLAGIANINGCFSAFFVQYLF